MRPKDGNKHSEICAEIAALQGRQYDSMRMAAFLGWSSEEWAEHERRAERLRALILDLAALGMEPPS
jgi:hypothetical protein